MPLVDIYSDKDTVLSMTAQKKINGRKKGDFCWSKLMWVQISHIKFLRTKPSYFHDPRKSP